MLRLLPEEEYPEDHVRLLAFLECWCAVPQVVSQEGLVVGVPQDLESSWSIITAVTKLLISNQLIPQIYAICSDLNFIS